MVQWRGRRRSTNVEDLRGRGTPRRTIRLGRGGGIKLKSGIGTIVLIAVVYFMGGDLGQILSLLLGGDAPVVSQHPRPTGPEGVGRPGGDTDAEFVSVILADTEETWGRIFRESGQRYPEPKLTLFPGAVNSACGYNTAAVGPFYCPPDQKVYLDLSFFQQLQQLGAPGDFAQAYVIGHEVGHHVQNVMGVLPAVAQQKQRLSQTGSNRLQVLVELQADCFAGIWAHHAQARRDLLEPGDLEEGLRAAASIGDDTLQARAGRAVRPESFTHGSSAQRVEWFRRGFDSGQVGACDTFAAAGVQLSGVDLKARAADGNGRDAVRLAYKKRQSDVLVRGEGVVLKILPDDLKGSRHQKFILDLGRRHTLLVAHNIDLADRVANLREGDTVYFAGEYEWNAQGGVLHWTHHDPAGRHPGGWLKHRGVTYR